MRRKQLLKGHRARAKRTRTRKQKQRKGKQVFQKVLKKRKLQKLELCPRSLEYKCLLKIRKIKSIKVKFNPRHLSKVSNKKSDGRKSNYSSGHRKLECNLCGKENEVRQLKETYRKFTL